MKYSWNDLYYEHYWARYRAPTAYTPRTLIPRLVARFVATANSYDVIRDRVIRVLDIGAGNWNARHADPARPNGWLVELLLGDSDKLLRRFGLDSSTNTSPIRLECVLLDPFFSNEKGEYLDGRLRLLPEKRPFHEFYSDWKRTRAQTFDIVLSTHGLYGELERRKRTSPGADDEGLAEQLRNLCSNTGILYIVQSAACSLEKQLKFIGKKSNSGIQELLDRFKDTDADYLSRLLATSFLLDLTAVGAALDLSGFEHEDPDSPEFKKFSQYYFRVENEDTETTTFSLARHVLFESLRTHVRTVPRDPYDSPDGNAHPRKVVPATFYFLTGFPTALSAAIHSPEKLPEMVAPRDKSFLHSPQKIREYESLFERTASLFPEAQHIYLSHRPLRQGRIDWTTLATGDNQLAELARNMSRELTDVRAHAEKINGLSLRSLIVYPLIFLARFEPSIIEQYPLFLKPAKLASHTSYPILFSGNSSGQEGEEDAIHLPEAMRVDVGKVEDFLAKNARVCGFLEQLFGSNAGSDVNGWSFYHPNFTPSPEQMDDIVWFVKEAHEFFRHEFTERSQDPAVRAQYRSAWDQYVYALSCDPHISRPETFHYFLFLRAQLLAEDHFFLYFPFWSHVANELLFAAILGFSTTYKRAPKMVSVCRTYLEALGTHSDFLLSRAAEYSRARQSAAAAIMSRNTSHNIGSHVTSRTYMDDLKRRVKELLLPTDWWDGGDWNGTVYPILKELKDKLDEYLQRKEEFVAEFSTDPLISMRSAWFYSDVILPLVNNTALMDTLAANEGFTYEKFYASRLAIRCWRETKSGRVPFRSCYRSDSIDHAKFDWPAEAVGAPYGLRHPSYPSAALYAEACAEHGAPRDVRVALPGPVGEMAIYSILENLIRNAAKHATGNRGSVDKRHQLIVDVVINEGEVTDPDCEVRLWDSLSDAGKKDDEAPLYRKIQALVEKDIIQSNGELRDEGWGTAEMVLCANLLQRLQPGVNPKDPCLKVFDPDDDPGTERGVNNRLIFGFKIPKARTAVFFGWPGDADVEMARYHLASAGHLVFPIDHLIANPASSIPPSDFAVVDVRGLSPDQLVKIHASRNRLPFRIILVGAVQAGSLEAPTEIKDWLSRVAYAGNQDPLRVMPSQISLWLWKTWIAHLRRLCACDAPLGIDIYLEQSKSERPTQRWVEKADGQNALADDSEEPSTVILTRIWGRAGAAGIHCLTSIKSPRVGERRVVVDRHGSLLQEQSVGSGSSDRMIVIDKASSDFDVLFNPSFDEPWTTPYELAEAGLLRILIIDERIVQRALKEFNETGSHKDRFLTAFGANPERPATVWHVARKAGVHIVTHIVLESSAEEETEVFTVASRDWGKAAILSEDPAATVTVHESAAEISDVDASDRFGKPIEVDLVVVHQGIADCLNGRRPGLGDRLLEALADRYWLVTESGRGIPPEVQKATHKFLSFSVIERTFRNGRTAKLGLTRATMAATRLNRAAGSL